MAAPTVRATTSLVTTGASATGVINKPAGTAVGDVIVICVAHSTAASSGVLSCPGFTLIDSDTGGWDVAGTSAVLARVADGSEGSTFTITDSSGAGSSIGGWAGVCTSIQGGGGLPDAHAVAFTTGSSSCVTPSITSLANDSIDLRFSIDQGNTTDTNVPAGYTPVVRAKETNGNTDVLYVWKAQAVAGVLGTVTFTAPGDTTTRRGGYSLTVPPPSTSTTTTAPFISAATTLYTPGYTLLNTETAPFIAAGTTVYQPSGLSEHMDVPFISSSTTIYTPSYTLNLNEAAPFVAAATSVYTPTLANSGIDRYLGQAAAISV